jgi:triacylglycerol lipase
MRPLDTRHLVDPELVPLLDLLPRLELTSELLPTLRSRPSWLAVDPRDRDRTEVVDRLIPGPPGAPDVGVRVYRPVGSTGPLPCILHLHGGGYVTGKAADLEGVHLPLAADLGCCIVSVDYRLAPETPFPGAIEDCYAALTWVVGHAAEIGVDADRIGVMGESAGGGLAAALALLVRDRAEHRLTFQHLIYPMLDDRTCLDDDPHPHVGEFVWNRESNRFGWSSLLGCEPGAEGISPYAAPARAEHLEGLPRTYLAVGSIDLFLEEDLEYARRLSRAGVPVELHLYAGGFHGFNAALGARIAADARRDSCEGLTRAMKT